MPRNARVTASPGRRLNRCTALLPRLALAAAFVSMALPTGIGLAQDTAGETEAGESAPGLRLKSVIMPEPVIVDPAPGPAEVNAEIEADAETDDPADSPAGEAAPATPRNFRIGIVPPGDAGAFLRALEPFRAAVAETLSRPVEILPFTGFTALIDAQVLHRIDLGFYSASAFALADKACSCLDPLVAPAAADGSMAFHGIIVALRQSGIASIDDLEGLEIAAGPTDSVGSRRIQMAELSAGGIDVGNYFSSVKAARNALDAILMARDDQVDAAFTWSSLTGDTAAGYSRGPLARLVARGEVSMDEIAIVWRSRPIAHAPVAVAKSLPEDVRQALAEFFVRLANDDPQTYDMLDRDYGGGYRPVKRQDYAGALILASQDPAVRQAEPALPIPRARPQPSGNGGGRGN